MKNYIVEKNMISSMDGYFDVVVEGEVHFNCVRIRSSIQYFTHENGYNYCHPWDLAKEHAEAIANGLNLLQQSYHTQVKKAL